MRGDEKRRTNAARREKRGEPAEPAGDEKRRASRQEILTQEEE
jgi:hypothetical protein